jgi:hypothetical protein
MRRLRDYRYIRLGEVANIYTLRAYNIREAKAYVREQVGAKGMHEIVWWCLGYVPRP